MDTAGLMIFFVVYIGLMVVIIAGVWKVFTKAGEPGWACLVPIYNAIVLLRVAGKEWWWIFLLMIPFVGLIIAIMVCLDLAKNFGKGPGFGVGLALLGFIFFPILGFGDAQYQGNGSPGTKRKRRRAGADDEWEERGSGQRGRAAADAGAFEEDRPRSSRRADVDDEREERVTSSKPAARGNSPGAGDSSVVQCPSCDKKLRVAASALGKRVKCPGCGGTFVAE